MSKRVLVPLAPGCEELEAVTIIDLLRRADIEVVVAGLIDGVITSRSAGTVLDFALELIQALSGTTTRQSVESSLERA